jgi:hypothetical protein
VSNPYEPPKAPVADVGAAPRLPSWVRALRAVAVVCSALVAVIGPAAYASSPQAAVFIFACALVALGGTSILALVSRRAGRKMYWAAMLLNGVLVLILNLAPSRGALLFIVPALLNMTAIEVLRRARLALERSQA